MATGHNALPHESKIPAERKPSIFFRNEPVMISKYHAVILYNTEPYEPWKGENRFGVFDVTSNQLVLDLPLDDYQLVFESRISVHSSPDEKYFVIFFLGTHNPSDGQHNPPWIMKLFDSKTLLCKRTEVFQSNQRVYGFDHQNAVFYGRHLIAHHYSHEKSGYVASFFYGDHCFYSSLTALSPFDDEITLQTISPRVQWDIVNRNFDPKQLHILRPNLIAGLHDFGITLYEIDKTKTQVLAFDSFIPKDIQLPKSKYDLKICYSPDGLYACLSFNVREEGTHLEHLQLARSNEDNPVYKYHHLGSYTLKNEWVRELCWADNNIFYVYSGFEALPYRYRLVILDPDNGFRVKEVLRKFEVHHAVKFTTDGRLIDTSGEQLQIYEPKAQPRPGEWVIDIDHPRAFLKEDCAALDKKDEEDRCVVC